MEYRRMTEKDAKLIAEQEKLIFSDGWSARSILETLRQPRALGILAEKEGDISGYLLFYFVLNEGEIVRIATVPHMRHQGVARGLVAELEKLCAQKEISRILLEVRESNEAARNFYTKCGFSEDGVRRGYYEHPKEDAVLMSREVGK